MFLKIFATTGAILFAGSLQAATPAAVINHYADVAEATYSDALTTARTLQQTIDTLISAPTENHLAAAREAWVAARHPYQQTETFRFGNAIVDDWEGKVNAWPLDEGLIDYTAASYGGESDENPFYTANIIANPVLKVGGKQIDAQAITPTLLADTLHEVDGVETNVATGYHAIEFLLWGQDLNGTGPGAGQRPASDFDPANCSWGHCERRAAYLKAAIDLLVSDLEWMTAQWASTGAARTAVTQAETKAGLATILTGMGSLSYGELAGERMKLGLMLHDPEEEHDCFSDNTHWSHYNDALGIRNVYTGTYRRVDGSTLSGPAIADLVAAANPDVDRELHARLDDTVAKMQVLVDTAHAGEAYDQMIGAGNTSGNAKVRAAIDALVAQTRGIEQAVSALGLEQVAFEGSDSLDAPQKVVQ
ncbi:MAG: peptidase [Gammaproteobacteria bacterium]|nr:peptidase [Gammaproteobacteria bacterium]